LTHAAKRPGKLGGQVCVALAAVLWSSNGLFAKSPVFDDWPLETRGLALAFWRALFAGLWLLPLVRRPRWNPQLVVMTLCFTGMSVTFLESMTLTTAANAIWLQSTAPLWVFLCGLWIWHEPLERRDMITLGSGLAGVSVILAYELTGVRELPYSTEGVICGLFSGIFFAVVVVSMRHLRGENSAWLMVVNLLTTAALLGPYALVYGPFPSPGQLLVLCAFGLFQMGLPYLLFARGLREISGQEGAGIGLLEPVLVPLWVYWAWGEQPAWWTILGGALILAGLVARYSKLGAAIRPVVSES
jgi:DME family drug/metabolite transporter